jgi:hypothetical protein
VHFMCPGIFQNRLVGWLVGLFIGWLVSSATRRGLFGLFSLCPLFIHTARVHRLLEV